MAPDAEFARKDYRSPRWRAYRRRVLFRDRYRCRACGRTGRLEVDHVKPRREHPERAWDISNLQALCRGCHIAKTRRENQQRRRPPKPRGPLIAAWDALIADEY